MKKISRKCLLLALPLLFVIGFSSTAQAKWQNGIGTGFTGLNYEGDIGFNTLLAGPVKVEVDLDPEDTSDLLNTAFGFGGFSTDGKWMIQYSFSNIELEGDAISPNVNGTVTFESTGGELTVGYPLYQDSSLNFRVYGGLRYTKHDWETNITVLGTPINSSFDENWTDGLVGISLDVAFTDKVSWNTRLDGGFGGSEGTAFVKTGIGWRFHENWSTSLYGKYAAVEYENNNIGDADWYFYDVDEFGAGIGILFIW